MAICFPGVYIQLYIIFTVQKVNIIELYTYNPDTQSYACIIRHYMSSESSVTSLNKKTKVWHGHTLI